MERTDKILCRTKVNRCFSSDRGINLGKESCRNIIKVYTPHIYCARKACHISRYSAAERNHAVGTGKVLFKQRFANCKERIRVFVFLALRKGIQIGFVKLGKEAFGVFFGNAAVRYNKSLALDFQKLPRFFERAFFNDYVIAVVCK